MNEIEGKTLREIIADRDAALAAREGVIRHLLMLDWKATREALRQRTNLPEVASNHEMLEDLLSQLCRLREMNHSLLTPFSEKSETAKELIILLKETFNI